MGQARKLLRAKKKNKEVPWLLRSACFVAFAAVIYCAFEGSLFLKKVDVTERSPAPISIPENTQDSAEAVLDQFFDFMNLGHSLEVQKKWQAAASAYGSASRLRPQRLLPSCREILVGLKGGLELLTNGSSISRAQQLASTCTAMVHLADHEAAEDGDEVEVSEDEITLARECTQEVLAEVMRVMAQQGLYKEASACYHAQQEADLPHNSVFWIRQQITWASIAHIFGDEAMLLAHEALSQIESHPKVNPDWRPQQQQQQQLDGGAVASLQGVDSSLDVELADWLLRTHGLLLDYMGRYTEAFGYTVRAVRARGQDEEHQMAAHSQLSKLLQTMVLSRLAYTPARISGLPTATIPTPAAAAAAAEPLHLVVIVGPPRSGGTLLQTMLQRHAGVKTTGEESFFLASFDRLVQKYIDKPDRGEWQATGGAEGGLGAVLNEFSQEWAQAEANGILKGLDERFRPTVATAAAAAAAAAATSHVVSKCPQDFVHLPLLLKLLPNVKVLHTSRDPLDAGLSMFMQAFGDRNQAWTNDLTHIGLYLQQYLALMSHWRQVLPADSFMTVEYEQLVQAPEDTLKRVVQFIGGGLQYTPSLIAPNGSSSASSEGAGAGVDEEEEHFTASLHQVRQEVYTKSVGRARKYEEAVGASPTAAASKQPQQQQQQALPHPRQGVAQLREALVMEIEMG